MRLPTGLAIWLVALCYVAWGSGMPSMKIALAAIAPLQVMALRVIAPGLIYLCLLPRWINCRIKPGDWKYFITLALCEPVLFFFCAASAMRFTTATEGSVIAALLPMAIALGAAIFLKERIPAKALFWLLAAACGVIGMTLLGSPSVAAPDPLLGNALMLAGVFFSAGYTLLARRLSQDYPGLLISAFQAFIGCFAFCPLALAMPWPQSLTGLELGAILWLAFGVGFGVYFVYNYALARVKAGVAGALANLAPVFGVALAALVLGEELPLARLACCGIVLLATILAGQAMKS